MRFFFICLIYFVCATQVVAQTVYYKNDKTFIGHGYTYQCDVHEGSQMVTLYNQSNQYTYVDQIVKSTGKLTPIKGMSATFVNDNWTKTKCYEIVNSILSDAEKQRLKDWGVSIGIYVSSTTGQIQEVDYQFTTFNPWATIPLAKYRNIETRLKDEVWFTPTEYGKGLNYIFLNFRYEIE